MTEKFYYKKLFKFLNLIINFIIIKYCYFKFIKIKIKKKKIKICLCVIGKKENRYIKEFVNHYKKLGYNKIFIYDNNQINDEKFEDIIQDEVDKGFVSIINYRGLKGKQFSSYRDCYKKNNKKFDWLSFFDFDEFLELRASYKKIQDFLGERRFKKCQNIKINWIYYNNKNGLYYENKPLEKRIPKRTKLGRCIKSTVRGNLSVNYWSKMGNPHTSFNKFISCSSSGKIINYSSPFNIPPDVKYAYLKHYYIKSFEEQCIKIQRGYADRHNENITLRIKNFFNLNKKNKNKLKIMKKIFNISSIDKIK